MWLIVVAALCLAACSRTVQWQEEVLLNTGEIITIDHTTEMHYDISQDRLLSPYWQFTGERLDFVWQGVAYSYRNEPSDPDLATISPLILAIDPHGMPTVLGYVDHYWVHHKWQGCAQSPIVRLIPQLKEWRIAPAGEPWAVDLRVNLRSSVQLPIPGTRLTWAEKAREFETWPSKSHKLDPNFIVDSCIGRERK